jgi:hypothetical protein
MTHPKRRNAWFDVEYQKAVNIRKEARMKMIQRETRANTLEYTKARKEAKVICPRKKKEDEENIFQEIQERYMRNEARKFYEGIRNIKKKVFNQELPFVGMRTGTKLVGNNKY